MQLRFRHFMEQNWRFDRFAQAVRAQSGFDIVFETGDKKTADSAAQSPDDMDRLPAYIADPGDLPEIVMASGETVGQLAKAGFIVPLDAFLDSPDGLPRGDFHDRLLDTVTYRGEVWALPVEGNPYALFCNLDLFEQAGLSSLPTTWGELMTASLELMADSDGDGKSNRYGYTQCTFQVPLLVWQAGGEMVSEDGSTCLFGSEEAARALKYHADLRTYSPPHVEFEWGDVGMKLSIVDYFVDGRYDHLNFEIVPLPRGRIAANSFGQSQSVVALAICRSSPEREQAAWRFLRWAGGEGALAWSTAMGYIPMRKSVQASPEWQAFLERVPKLRAFNDQIAICKSRPCSPAYKAVKWYFAMAVHDSRPEEERRCTMDQAREIVRRFAALAQEKLDRQAVAV